MARNVLYAERKDIIQMICTSCGVDKHNNDFQPRGGTKCNLCLYFIAELSSKYKGESDVYKLAAAASKERHANMQLNRRGFEKKTNDED